MPKRWVEGGCFSMITSIQMPQVFSLLRATANDSSISSSCFFIHSWKGARKHILQIRILLVTTCWKVRSGLLSAIGHLDLITHSIVIFFFHTKDKYGVDICKYLRKLEYPRHLLVEALSINILEKGSLTEPKYWYDAGTKPGFLKCLAKRAISKNFSPSRFSYSGI